MQPWFITQRHTLQDLYIPPEWKIPPGDTTWQVFFFPLVNPLEVQEQTWAFERPFVAHTLTGVIADIGNGVVDAAGFRLQMVHAIAGGPLRRIFNKHQLAANVAGTGTLPFTFPEPYAFAKGDKLMVEVKSLVGAGGLQTSIWVNLLGVAIEPEWEQAQKTR